MNEEMQTNPLESCYGCYYLEEYRKNIVRIGTLLIVILLFLGIYYGFQILDNTTYCSITRILLCLIYIALISTLITYIFIDMFPEGL